MNQLDVAVHPGASGMASGRKQH